MLLRKLSSGFLLPPLLVFGQKMPFLCKARSLSSSSEGPCTGADDGVRLVDSVSPLRCRHLSCRRVFALASLAFQTSHNTLHLNHLSSTGPSLSFLPPSSPSLSVPLHGSSLSNPIIYLLLPPGALFCPVQSVRVHIPTIRLASRLWRQVFRRLSSSPHAFILSFHPLSKTRLASFQRSVVLPKNAF